MTQDYNKPTVEYFSKPQDFDKPSPVFFRKQGNQWTPVGDTASHPISPSPEIIGEWWIAWNALDQTDRPRLEDFIAVKAAQYGADQELEACCEWLGCGWKDIELVDKLRSARRPKPPSLKELALDDLRIAFDRGCLSGIQADTIRRALEQLPDCE